MASTSSSTFVAVSRRPSSRAPACAVLTAAEAARRRGKYNVAANCFVMDIKTPKVGGTASPAKADPVRRGWSLSLPRVGRRENPHGLGVSMMRSIVFGQSRGRLLRRRVLRTYGRQQFRACRDQHGLAFRGLVARDQRPPQTRFAAR